MPLYPNAKDLIRKNLEALRVGERVPRVVIGRLMEAQIRAINTQQEAQNLPLSVAEIVFIGRHIHKRRILEDGYAIDDVLSQIESAMAEWSEIIATSYMTVLRNPIARRDRLGNLVHDEIVFECSKYRPNPELFSVVPKGDKFKPEKQKDR